MKHKSGRRGIYLLPNLLTTASLFAAFYSIIASMKGMYEASVMAILIGMVADGLDGRIARMTNTQTAFGAEYDSLADMVTFGVSPAVLLYSWALEGFGKLGWLAAFIYTASVALRLARFNTQIDTDDKRYFQGLPCPIGAAVLASFVWVCQTGERASMPTGSVLVGLLFLVAFLMVSNIRYHSFKEIDLKGKISFIQVLAIVIGFVTIAAAPSTMLFLGSFGFALSGPFQTLTGIKQVRTKRRRKNKK